MSNAIPCVLLLKTFYELKKNVINSRCHSLFFTVFPITSLHIQVQMTLFYETIQKAEKHSKLLSIISALAAASFTVYCAKKVVDNIENKKEADNGYDKIPIPEGCYYYLGNYTALQTFSWLELKTGSINRSLTNTKKVRSIHDS